ncbi:membrane fusion protein, multidrug efflux system [Nitrosospira multiformis ATCC 25196]|uniref:Membrane fusion protein, multidrug efflux system n=1 Tax=Nitrosospira multiformis (strain ATCC 25196 / NCIMB 11849 / C 71) TaxID=323848 RepID=Q2YD20_NITMU|nr:efflux RND transporter periplasmic adaptor subunit [Nitrosospira multiformis]ABB73351.1 Secretion protein HlyD [Nitrosospira multiformis ATCC 25196]SEG13524.1 membrane fusion protein, multidrug efflux system [Nitrosospira multiformis ATCC 25196]
MRFINLITTIFIALSTIFLAACSNTESSTSVEPPPPDVAVADVLSRSVRAWDEFNGRVRAVPTVELRPRVSGYIDRVAYKEGSEVKPGDLLFVIDPRPYRNALQSAQAQLEHARAAANLAQSRTEHAQALFAAQAMSREEFNGRQTELNQTIAEVRAAEAAVATAKLNLNFTEVRAPIAGRVGRAYLTAGNLAQADQSILTTLVSQDPMYVYFDCDEHNFLRYKEFARKNDRESNVYPVRIRLANEEGFSHHGTVDFFDNQLNPATGTIRVRAVVANADRALTPGLHARVQLQGGDVLHALLIDDKAILTDQDRKYVYVLGEGNKALRKNITLGRQVDGLRIVQSGLDTTDKIIVIGAQKIFHDGMTVKPQHVAMETRAAIPPSTLLKATE